MNVWLMPMVSSTVKIETLPVNSLKSIRLRTRVNKNIMMSINSSLQTIYGCSRNSTDPYTSKQSKEFSVRLRNSVHKTYKSTSSMRVSQEENDSCIIARKLLFSKIDDYIKKMDTIK